jgi:hypothetical protein
VNDWLILSDTPLGRLRAGPAAMLAKGLFAFEFHLPLTEPTVLLDYRTLSGAEATLSVLFDPTTGISILHRQGGEQCRYVLPGPLPNASGVARLSLHFDSQDTGVWLIRLELPNVMNVLDASGPGSLPFDLNAFDRLCSHSIGSKWHGAVLWFGLSKGTSMPPRRSWIGRNTPVMTARGLVFAEALRAGDSVQVLDHGYKTLGSIARIEVPSRGTFAPVLLRTPFFGATRDLMISADQMVLVGGSSVEYVCGVEEVLIRSGVMVNGRTAMLENRRSSTIGVTLDFDMPVLLPVDGIALMIPTAGWGRALPRRVLADHEAHPLLPITGAGSVRINA